MTSHFHSMWSMGRNQTWDYILIQFTRWRHQLGTMQLVFEWVHQKGQVCYLQFPCSFKTVSHTYIAYKRPILTDWVTDRQNAAALAVQKTFLVCGIFTKITMGFLTSSYSFGNLSLVVRLYPQIYKFTSATKLILGDKSENLGRSWATVD